MPGEDIENYSNRLLPSLSHKGTGKDKREHVIKRINKDDAKYLSRLAVHADAGAHPRGAGRVLDAGHAVGELVLAVAGGVTKLTTAAALAIAEALDAGTRRK